MNKQKAAANGVSLILAAVVLPGWETAAAAIEVIPQLDTGITWESNPRYFSDEEKDAAEALDPDITDSVTGTFVDARLRSTYRTRTSQVAITPRIRKTDYLGGNRDLSDDDLLVDLASVRAGLLGNIGLNGSWRDVSIRTGEFDSATPENPNDPPPTTGGSGRFASQVTQESWSLQPFLTYTLSSRNELSLQALLSETDYVASEDVIARRGYLDYDYSTTSLAVTHTLDEKNAVRLSLNGTSFDAQQENSLFRNKTDTFGLGAAWERVFSPTLSGTLEFGLSRSSIDLSGIFGCDPAENFLCGLFIAPVLDPVTGAICIEANPCVISNEERNFVGDLGLRKRGELLTVNFNLTRSIAPRSDGSEVVQDQVRVFVDREFTRRLRASAGAIFSDESAVGSGLLAGSNLPVVVRQDRRYLTFDTTVFWRLTPTLTSYAKYSFVSNETKVSSGTVDEENNRLFFGISYRGIGFRR